MNDQKFILFVKIQEDFLFFFSPQLNVQSPEAGTISILYTSQYFLALLCEALPSSCLWPHESPGANCIYVLKLKFVSRVLIMENGFL